MKLQKDSEAFPLFSDWKPSEAVKRVHDAVVANEQSLTDLDKAIGDGDHGRNMVIGCEALLQHAEELDVLDLNAMFEKISSVLFNNMGGAAGALYGTLFAKLAFCLAQENELYDFSQALHRSAESVRQRGKVEVGNKTLFDVLYPVSEFIKSGSATFSEIANLAEGAAESTIPMTAKRGRASLLGERSQGHLDPGALSCAIIVRALCEYFGEKS
ncbi:dihydroxyacetone kinase subunit L [Alteromonas sp. ZYF713]|nr:dihydroxyacetone kinase subunit L [Alteromonas sp. ZYF713]